MFNMLEDRGISCIVIEFDFSSILIIPIRLFLASSSSNRSNLFSTKKMQKVF